MYGIKSSSPIIKPSSGSEPFSLKGKKVIIVGGTAGIGAGLALQARSAGASVVIIGRTLRDTSFAGESFVKADLSLLTDSLAIAKSLPFETADFVLFTTGIVPGNVRQVTKEGIEMDMSTSALNRHVILKEAAPRLRPNTRVFIWGFPGTADLLKKTNLADFNSEIKYDGGFGTAHMNTVALNEALVHHWAAKGMLVSGFNPGLMKTGIRESLLGTGIVSYIIEGIAGWFNPTVETYSKNILPLFTAPELDTHKGLFFHQSGVPIKPSPEMTDPKVVEAWIAAADALAAKALS